MNDNFNISSLKKYTKEQLKNLCLCLREKIKDTVMKNGGHLSSNLGVVDVTVALCYVFDFPIDKIVFDVGHQCYAYKLLTGRADRFDTLRHEGGISGFPKRSESEFDSYETGHAGTAFSAALGLAKARDLSKEDYFVISLVGDGSFNNGLIYEALNSVNILKTNVLVILNDNGMSISPTVGSMHKYLDDLKYSQNVVRADVFEKFGMKYFYEENGNDVISLIERLNEIKEVLKTKPVLFHIMTKKGMGYDFCEDDPQNTHGYSPTSSNKSDEYSKVLGDTLVNLAQKNDKVVAVTAAMTSALGLDDFFEKFPERAFDVGICEEHASILCSALACGGYKPYYAIYSSFLQRTFDELIHDICGQNLPVTLCIDRSGITGADGETHQGVFDLSYLSMIPNMTVAVPKDAQEFAQMLELSLTYNSPLAIRYPRSAVVSFPSHERFAIGEWEILKGTVSCETAIIACGERILSHTLETFENFDNILIVNARFVKPLDFALLDKIKAKNIITIEDNVKIGGLGSRVCDYYAQSDKKVKIFAYDDKFITHGSIASLSNRYGVNFDEIKKYVLDL